MMMFQAQSAPLDLSYKTSRQSNIADSSCSIEEAPLDLTSTTPLKPIEQVLSFYANNCSPQIIVALPPKHDSPAAVDSIFKGTARHVCQFCQNTYSKVCNLRRHQRLSHPEMLNKLAPIKCPQCSQTFFDFIGLRIHVSQSHTNNVTSRRPAVVLQGSSSSSNEELVNIGSTMTVSDGGFQQRARNNVVLSTLNDVNNQEPAAKRSRRGRYPCRFCPKSFVYSMAAREHERICHREAMEVVCDFATYCFGCSTQFPSSKSLQAHLDQSSNCHAALEHRRSKHTGRLNFV